MKSACVIVLMMVSGAEAALRFGARDPKGPGHTEPTMAGACAECKVHAPYLDRGDDCSCHASDIMRTFANDATKTLTTAKGYGSETANTGAKELASGFVWHCRPVSATAGVWQAC